MSVLQGDIQFTCVPAVAVVPQVKAGRVNALAVSTAKRIPQLPDVPTMREAGYPDAESSAWMAVMAPAGTPAEIVSRLNGEINAVLQMPEMRERMANAAMEPVGGSVELLAAHLRDELRKWTPIIKRSGATLD
jgi:tripartite-type tricarboxylate transporter receptor subunit TctC